MRDLLIKAGLGALSAAYAREVVQRPQQVARLARSVANRSGKPLANLGAGVVGRSIRASLLGPRLFGDVNLDSQATVLAHGPGVVSYCDYYRLPFVDAHFGALLACDVLENLEYPELALQEWNRVADRVFVLVPSKWRPDKWTSRWMISSDLKKAWPLWARRSHILRLPMSDTPRYGAPRCQTTLPTASSTPMALRPQTAGIGSSSSVSTLTVLSGSSDENI